ncbi:hypothetical protein TcCL_Unassigned00179 [Trypanosoma cruzi]|nr:hypothetical protein TcCL_Unassigned00179 [Trypanosoma cruzi]
MALYLPLVPDEMIVLRTITFIGSDGQQMAKGLLWHASDGAPLSAAVGLGLGLSFLVNVSMNTVWHDGEMSQGRYFPSSPLAGSSTDINASVFCLLDGLFLPPLKERVAFFPNKVGGESEGVHSNRGGVAQWFVMWGNHKECAQQCFGFICAAEEVFFSGDPA